MDIAARDSPFGMAHQGCDGRPGAPQVVGDTGEAMAEDVGRNTVKRGVLDQLPPVFGKSNQWLSVFGSREHEASRSHSWSSSRSRTGSPIGRMDAPSLLSFRRRQLLSA